MKMYSILITIIAISALGVAIYFGYQYQDIKNQKKSVENEMNSAKDEVVRIKSSITNFETTIIALDATVDSFSPTGDSDVGYFSTEKATTAREKIGDITDEKDKEMVLIEWDRFRSSSKINDFQQLLKKFTENLNRSLDNINSNKF